MAPGQVAAQRLAVPGQPLRVVAHRDPPELTLAGHPLGLISEAGLPAADQRALRCLVNMLFPSTDYGWVLVASVVQSGLLEVISEAVRALGAEAAALKGNPEYAMCCTDGPVFEAHDLDWDLVT